MLRRSAYPSLNTSEIADTVPLAHAPAVGSVHVDGDAVVVRIDGTRYRMSPRTARALADRLASKADLAEDD